MTEHQEIRQRLAAIGKERKWLAKQLGLSAETVRQYLQPKGKRTPELLAEIDRIITLETARLRENQPDAPPWNLLFKTDEEFDRVDIASRICGAESLKEFCRNAILDRAADIIGRSKRGIFPKPAPLQRLKIAEKEKP